MERGGGYFCGLGIRSQTNSCTYINIILFVIICVRIYLFVFIQIKKGGEGEEEGDAPPPPPSIDYTSQPPSDDRGTEANNRNLRLYGEAVRYWRITLPLLLLASPGT